MHVVAAMATLPCLARSREGENEGRGGKGCGGRRSTQPGSR